MVAALAIVERPALYDVSGAETDRQLVSLWLRGRPETTRRAYAHEAERFLAHVGSLRAATVRDVQSFAESLTGSPATVGRALSAVKSLLSYGQRCGYLAFNVGVALRLPARKNDLAARIMSEADMQRMIALAEGRDHLILRTLYATGLRVSELCGLSWGDAQPRDEGGQLCIFGKGGKTRTVLLPKGPWAALMTVKPLDAVASDPVFVSREGGRLHPSSVWRIVRKAARKAGIASNVSPHWLRHGHASHALDRGCPVHVLQDSLGHASLATTSRYSHVRPGDGSSRYLAV